MRKIIFSIATILLVIQSLKGQGDAIFSNDVVHEIRLTFDESNFWNRLSQNYDQFYPDVPYVMADVVIDGVVVDSIGVRLKGFSSYFTTETDKKSIKLDFNEFVKGKRYNGLRKLNLNNGQGDPAMQRDAFSYSLLRKSGVSAPRTAYSRVYLNDTFWGLYLIVEQIDKEFLDRNFGTTEGHLFKNMENSDLNWLGTSPSEYQNIFELKTGEDDGAWGRFVSLMNVINHSSSATFKEEIEKVFDVDRYLKVLVIDVALDNWDSYIEHGRNFYLYENINSNQFQWIPWDYNLAMGGTFSAGGPGGPGGGPGDLAECASILDGTCPYPPDDFILEIVMIVDETCCDTWTGECQAIYDEFSPPPAEECPTVLNGTCPYPPTDSILQTVFTFAPFCCEFEWGSICDEIYDDIASGEGPGGGGGFGSSFPVDMSDSEKVLISRLLSVPEFQEKYYQYWCQFLDHDFLSNKIFPSIDYAGDLIREDLRNDMNSMWTFEAFEADLDQGSDHIIGLKKFISERIPVLNAELEQLYSCTSTPSDLSYQDLVINEFSASSDSLSSITDSNGDYDDWIEIYNNTNERIDLSQAYLSDDSDNPTKWKFPLQTTIDADEYLIVWADKDDGQQGLHANFKLAKDGEFIILTIYDTVLDSLSYEPQITNQSAARIPNGTGSFVTNRPTTFGFNNNDASSTKDNVPLDYALQVWPNPARDIVHVRIDGLQLAKVATKRLSLSVINSYGAQLKSHSVTQDQFQISMEDYDAGMYIINLSSPHGKVHFSTKVIKL